MRRSGLGMLLLAFGAGLFGCAIAIYPHQSAWPDVAYVAVGLIVAGFILVLSALIEA